VGGKATILIAIVKNPQGPEARPIIGEEN